MNKRFDKGPSRPRGVERKAAISMIRTSFAKVRQFVSTTSVKSAVNKVSTPFAPKERKLLRNLGAW